MSIDDQNEFESMKKIGSIVANCLELLKARARPGMTTLELDEMAGKFLSEHGAISAPKSVYKFPGFTCLSLEYAVAHGIPDNTVIKEGDLLNIDVSAQMDGYFADNGESIVVGKGQSFKHQLCTAVKKTLEAALKKAQAGSKISNLGREVEKVAREHNLSVIRNLGGHGVGRSLHEEPHFIASFSDKTDRRIFRENQVVAIEPFVSNGAHEVEEASDGWTLYHPEFYCAQKEHTIMITKDLPFIFTTPTQCFA